MMFKTKSRQAVDRVSDLLKKTTRRQRYIAGFVALFALIGVLLINLSSAATLSVMLEAESGSVSGNGSVQTLNGASGGSGVRFGGGGTTPPPASGGTTPAAINGLLKTCGVQLCNQFGKPIQLRGMSTHGIQWYYQCISDASLDALANDWKADVMRVSLYVQEEGYETDPAGFTAKAQEIVDKLIARGLYVLIDWHQLSPGDPNANTAMAKTYFTAMATKYKDTPNVFYEIANEPNGVSWATIKQYADTMVPHIRAIDPDNPIIIGTHGWDTFGVSGEGPASDVYNNPVSGTNLLYTFHFYAADHSQEYRDTLDEASSKLPVFVTEWGTQEASGDGGNDFTSSQQYIDLMARKKISWTSWNYSDDPRTGAAWKEGTCPNGPWTTGNLKEAGTWVRDKILNPADDFPTQ